MNTTMTERFGIGGAMLVKLFGRYDTERTEFADRARRVRDIGVTSAMLGRIFFTALALVAAVGTAVVYWVGGRMVIEDVITLGTLVAMAAYVTRIYQPLTALTNARVDVMTAMVSFDRVFEVLDQPNPITDRPGAVDLVDPRGEVSFDDVSFAYPAGGSLALPGSNEHRPDAVATEDAAVLHHVSTTVAAGTTVALVGRRAPARPRCRRSCRAVRRERRCGASTGDVRDLTQASLRRHRCGLPGPAPVPRVDPRQPALRPTGRHRRRARSGVPSGASTTSSPRCPRGTTRSSVSAAIACPAARSSASPSPACC
ncbi:MAG: ABC transporter transmembrane domain-containing protein [Acidimicrobiales bacterium]